MSDQKTKPSRASGMLQDLTRSMSDLPPKPTGDADRPMASRRTVRGLMDRSHQDLDRESVTVLSVAPERVRIASGHDRVVDWLDANEVQPLIQAIQKEGQREPAVVRPVTGEKGIDYEIVAGARRWWVARYLHQKLRVIVTECTDEEAFRINETSNRYEQVSAFERALSMARALEQYYEGNQKQLATAMARPENYVSRMMALADIPAAVVKVCSDPREISMRHAERIRQIVSEEAGAEKIRSETKKIEGEGDKLPARTLFPRLFSAAKHEIVNQDDANIYRKGAKKSVGDIRRANHKIRLRLNLSAQQGERTMDALRDLCKKLGLEIRMDRK